MLQMILKRPRMTDLEVSDFDDVIATNLRGVWLGTK
jgi:NAD(P)-dependent dehydrogenase (short-subunit alcohol dehydrogenase family)